MPARLDETNWPFILRWLAHIFALFAVGALLDFDDDTHADLGGDDA